MSRQEYYNKAKSLGYRGLTKYPYGDKDYWKKQVKELEKPLIFVPISYISKILGFCDNINPKISGEYIDRLIIFNKNKVENRKLKKSVYIENNLSREVKLEKLNKIKEDNIRYSKLGLLYESDGIDLYKKNIYIDCKMEEQKELSRLYKGKIFDIKFIGKCDLYNETLNEIIEVKSRMKRLKGGYYGSEETQVQFYLHCSKLREGKLLEHYKGEYNMYDIIYNKNLIKNYSAKLYKKILLNLFE